MPSSFGKWVAKKLQRHDANDEQTSSPPYLGARTYPITPTSSSETIDRQASAAVSNSLLFTGLPVNVRRIILVQAFGGRTLHLDLRLDFPLRYEPVEGWPHGQVDAKDKQQWSQYLRHPTCGRYSSIVPRETSASKTWQWYGRVCHREPPGGLGYWPGGAFTDDCLDGYQAGVNAAFWPGKQPDNWNIGVMGWILSCRQAYREGIDVLYGTNTIAIESHELMRKLTMRPKAGDLLLQQRLGLLRSIELFLTLTLFQVDVSEQEKVRNEYSAIIRGVIGTFPSLKMLHISFGDRLWDMIDAPINHLEAIDNVICEPLKTIVASFGIDLTVDVPHYIFDAYRRSARARGVEFPSSPSEHWYKTFEAAVPGAKMGFRLFDGQHGRYGWDREGKRINYIA